MSGDNLDALGQIAEGALLGGAIEPGHDGQRGGKRWGEGTDGPNDGANCLNCGSEVTGNYCAHCGQKVHVHRTLTAFWHDLLHGALHFDGKMWRTLPLLAFKPGQLTRRYVDGERASFVSPMALFLFSIFLMFAVFQMIGLTAPTQINTPGTFDTNLERAHESLTANRDELQEGLTGPNLSPAQKAKLEAELKDTEESLKGLEQARDAMGEEMANGEMNVTGIDFIDEGIVKKWRENPSLMIYKLQANSYKFSWALIPLSIPFVWLLFFWRREFKAYDHAIFVTYSLAFMSLLFIVISALAFVGIDEAVIGLGALFIPPIHLYKQLRKTYDLSRFGAFWRLIVLSLFISIIIVLFLQMLLVLGAF